MTDQIEREKNLPEISKPMHPASIGASLFLDVNRFEFAQRVATMLSKSTMVPDHFRNNIGNCMIALNLAERFMADPFMVMQTVYIVHGKPGLEGKLVIALVNQCGKFSPLQYEFTRDKDGKATACTAYATHKETDEKLEQTVTWDMVHAEGWDAKKGSKWLTMPELMFQYRSATFFARVYCPEVILGMQTTDEIFDFTNMTNQGGVYKAENTDTSDLSEKIKQQKAESKEPSEQFKEAVKKQLDKIHAPKNDESEPTETETPETVEKAPEPKEQQKTEESVEENSEEFFRARWINMREPGFSSFVYKNRGKFDSVSNKLLMEAIEKWKKLYPRTSWPLKNPVEADSEDEKIQMIKAISDFFDPDDITKALREHEQEAGLTSCDMAVLRKIYTYLRENTEMHEDLA